MAPTNLVIEGYGAQISPVRPTLSKFLSNYIYQIFVIMKSPIETALVKRNIFRKTNIFGFPKVKKPKA